MNRGLPKLAVLPFQSLHLLGHFAWKSRPGTIVDFRLLHLSLSVCAVQPILAAIEETAIHREEYSPW